MTLDPALLEILACPDDKGPLLYFEQEGVLFNPRLRRTYAVVDGIPDMLIDEATTVSEEEAAHLTSLAASRGLRPTFDPGDAA